jgi:hypothetical protein
VEAVTFREVFGGTLAACLNTRLGDRTFLQSFGNRTIRRHMQKAGAHGSVVVKTLCFKREIAGSIPDEVIFFLNLPNPSGHTMPFTHPLAEMSTGNIKVIMFLKSMRGGCVGLKILPPSVSRLSRQCGILNISQPYRPPRPVTGLALLYGDGVCFL